MLALILFVLHVGIALACPAFSESSVCSNIQSQRGCIFTSSQPITNGQCTSLQGYCFCDSGYTCCGTGCQPSCTIDNRSIVPTSGAQCCPTSVPPTPTPHPPPPPPPPPPAASPSNSPSPTLTSQNDGYSNDGMSEFQIGMTIAGSIALFVVFCVVPVVVILGFFIYRRRASYTSITH